jgi:UDP-sugar pyrophosphorylase
MIDYPILENNTRDKIADLDESYPGGLPAYLTKARRLLEESSAGTNPFEEYEAHVPDGESLSYYDTSIDDGDYDESRMTFAMAENVGLSGIGNTAFVLVAGGLGERLGYSGIKLGLETNLLTNRCYLDVYCRYILAMQRMAREMLRASSDAAMSEEEILSIKIPLAIMTSDDTDPLTRRLLIDNHNFGFEPGQITIVKQDKVAALTNVDASLSMKGRWEIETKPHGHGDVHHLLYRTGLVDAWSRGGNGGGGHRVKHVIFLQDTNALVINSILPTLGVSIAKGFHMNSICIPRLAGEAAGAIARLE